MFCKIKERGGQNIQLAALSHASQSHLTLNHIKVPKTLASSAEYHFYKANMRARIATFIWVFHH